VIDWTSHRPILEAARANGATTGDLMDLVVWRERERGNTVERQGAVRDGVRRFIGTKAVAALRTGGTSTADRGEHESQPAVKVCAVPAPRSRLHEQESFREQESAPERTLPKGLIPPDPVPDHRVSVSGSPRSVLCLSDLHIPIHDKRAVDTVIAFARDQKPDVIVLAGDCVDCWLLSSFVHEADRLFEPGARLQEELDTARPIFDAIAATTGRVEYLLGNHEARLSKLVNLHPGTFGLRALEWSSLAGLPSNFTVHRYGARLRVGAMTFEHGDRIGSKMGLPIHAAHWVLNRHGGRNVAFGHSHRLEMRVRTVWDERGQPHEYVAINTGHLSDVAGHRYVSEPDWHPGFLWLDCWTDGGEDRFTPSLIPIVSSRFSFGGRLYGGCQ